MVYVESETESFMSRAMPRQSNISEETMRAVDLEIRRILEEQYGIARKLIEDNRDKMEAMAQALLKWETIDSDQIDDILAGKPPREPRRVEPVKGGKKTKPETAATESKPAEAEPEDTALETLDQAKAEAKPAEAEKPAEPEKPAS